MPYAIYLPPGYDSEADRSYPVLYMLHGLGGDYREWAELGLFEAADRLIAGGQIAPMIIVTPEGERGYWFDQADGGPRYGQYVARDLVNLVDTQYRTLASREGRAIGGVSMGAHGALQLAMNFPDTFSVVGAHSLVLRSYKQASSYFGDETYFRKYDPATLLAQRAPQNLDLWLDIGSRDPWFAAAEGFHKQLTFQSIPHTWRVYEGEHDAAYWRSNIAEYLRFYSEAFADHVKVDFARTK